MEQEKEQSTLKLELEYWLATTGSSQLRQKKKLGNSEENRENTDASVHKWWHQATIGTGMWILP